MKYKIFAWNSCSILAKKHEFSSFLSKNQYDIILLSETFLKPNFKIQFVDYNLYRLDRIRGGVAILIKSCIPHSNLRKVSTYFAECVSIEINDPLCPFSIATIYCSPSASRIQSQAFFIKALSLPGRLVIAGDFNAKHKSWNNITSNRRGIEFNKGLDLYNLCILKKFPFILRTEQH